MDNFNEDYEISDESHLENRKKDKKGETTQIFDYTLEEIQELDSLILDDNLNGKIAFNEPVNLTDNQEFSIGLINLSKAINISYNYIEINSDYFPGLNRFATLTLRNLTFKSPQILKNGQVCLEIECILLEYLDGDLTFLVNNFSSYSVQENPNQTQIPSESGRSGSSGSIFPWSQYKFMLNQEQISVRIQQGETQSKTINVTNYGKERIVLTLNESATLEPLLKITPRTLILEPGQSKLVQIDIIARENIFSEIYLGELMFHTNTKIQKSIPLLIEVVTKSPLFDVRIYVPEKYLQIMPGEEVYYSVEIFNLGDIDEEVDVEVEYNLINEKGETVTSHHESMAVRTRLSYIRHKEVPNHLPLGNYIIYLKVKYAGQVSSTSQMITLGPHSETEYPMPTFVYVIPLIISIIAMVILILLVWILLKLHKKPKRYAKVRLKKLKKRK